MSALRRFLPSPMVQRTVLRPALVGSVLAWACLLGPGTAAAAPDPTAAATAWRALLASANARIPADSSCHGDYGTGATPTVGDLLASQLAYMHRGRNRIEGQCRRAQCKLTLARAAGEDVSSITIEFRTARGRAVPASLSCLMTP